MEKKECLECRWLVPDNMKCYLEKCHFESRKEHADKLIARFTEIIDHPCGNCLNSLFCYKEGPNETRCSKVKSREEKERHVKYWRDKNA